MSKDGMDSTALLNHIISQTRQNIDFLVSQHQISAPDAQTIISKLPATIDPDVSSLSNNTHSLLLRAAPPPPKAPTPEPTRPAYPKARALWAYNEDRSDPNDLSFAAGDIIEIVAETNADWWTGRNKGSEGLFPANYVERLPSDTAPSTPAEKAHAPPFGAPVVYNGPLAYHPPPGPPMPGFAGPYQPPPSQHYQPPAPQLYRPPPPQQYQPYQAPPPQPEEPKKSKFGGGGLGNTLAHSAAGGVGFGAGAAVGGGIINSIF